MKHWKHWTVDDIHNLMDRQLNSGRAQNPYVCPNRGDGNHRKFGSRFGSHVGILIPTRHGLICPYCDHIQEWAHEVKGD